MGQRWAYSFRSADFTGSNRVRAARDDNAGDHPCARGDFCTGRRITVAPDGERTVTPALTYQAYCHGCRERIGACLTQIPDLYLRLGLSIGQPAQAEVLTRMPFGPRTPLREDIDAMMRLMASVLGGWHERVADVARLAEVDTTWSARRDTGRVVGDAVRILHPHLDALLALARGEMVRVLPAAAVPADAMIVAGDGWETTVIVMLGGEDAGREVLSLHYRARSLLLETTPPPEILVMPCRDCTMRQLRRAWAEGDRDLYSRCEHCGDEMTAAEYDQNSKRWVAYHKAQQRATLGAA